METTTVGDTSGDFNVIELSSIDTHVSKVQTLLQ